ncbi:MAG TPA: class I SAM-dependent methyltransferase [Candidatus Thermoplasmatota archaeon]|nr:class I SAM-dependent methyltransferase [Candidatus Thermoplasmatota archaeon]
MESNFSTLCRQGRLPWDIGRAQPAMVELANEGRVVGDVLEPGCGSGENTLEMAERGHGVLGFDAAPRSVELAREKATLRGLDATFRVRDPLAAARLGRRFGTVLDCGLFQTFDDAQRATYERRLRAWTADGGWLHILCLSDREDRRWGGPRRVSQQEIRATFADGWQVEDIREARLCAVPQLNVRGHAWLASLRRDTASARQDAPAARGKPVREAATRRTGSAAAAKRRGAAGKDAAAGARQGSRPAGRGRKAR